LSWEARIRKGIAEVFSEKKRKAIESDHLAAAAGVQFLASVARHVRGDFPNADVYA
jgi:hypothetical protein